MFTSLSTSPYTFINSLLLERTPSRYYYNCQYLHHMLSSHAYTPILHEPLKLSMQQGSPEESPQSTTSTPPHSDGSADSHKVGTLPCARPYSDLLSLPVICPLYVRVRRAICSVVARNNYIVKQLVFEAKREYEKDPEHRVHISLGDT